MKVPYYLLAYYYYDMNVSKQYERINEASKQGTPTLIA